MSMIRGLSQRMGLKKKDEAAANANTTTSGNTNSNTSGTSTNASGGSRIAGAGVSSVSPLELLLTQNNSNTNTNNTNNNNTTNTNNNLNTAPLSPRKNTARPPVPTSAPPSVTSSMRNLNADNSTATTTTTSVPFQQRLVYAVAPPVAASSSSPAPPAPRSNPPVKAASEELQIEFDEDDDDDDEQRSGGGGGGGSAKRSARPAMQRSKTRSSSADSSDDDSSGVDPDGPPPAAPLSPPEQEFDDDDDDSSDDNDSDAVLFADDREEFAEEPLPPVPSEPNPAVRSPPPPPSMANPQKQLVDELLDNDSHPLLAASAPSLSKFTSVRSSGESTTNPHQRERTLTRTTREKMLGPSSVSMRRSPPPMQQQQSLQSLHGSVSERTALFGGPGVGGPAAASFAAAAAAASRAGASPARAKDLTAPGLLKSVSEPASNRSAQQKTGWLVKKGKKRWFLLRGNVLYWFSKEVDPMADIGKGVNNYLQLAGCTVEATDSPRFSVRIAPPPGPKSKPYVLTAQDEATRARWMRSLVIAAAVRDESAVVTSGYMLKKGKRRFFVIEDDQLKWYLSSKMGKAEFKGCLQLATCRLSGAPLTDSVILESTSAAKSYELITSSPDEFKHWMNALETSIQHAQRSWRQRHGSSTLRAGGIASDVVVDGPPRSDAPLAFWTFQIEQTIPVTAADGGTFTTYMVDVTAPNGAQRSVLKRYRQFDDLDAALRRHGTDRALPSLPTKKLVGNMNPQFVRNRCLGLQRYLNQVAQLPGINELPEFIYFVTEHAAADGWHDSAPLQPADVLQRWAWIDEHRATPPPAPALVDATCVQGGLRIEFGCSERPPWLARAVDANAGAAATGGGAAGSAAVAASESGARSPRTVRGGDDDEHDVNVMVEEAIDRDVLYYRTFFAGRAHDNYVSPTDTELGPVALTVDGEGVAITSTSRVYKVLLRTKRGDRRYSLTSSRARGERLKELRAKLGLGDLPLTRVRPEDSESRFVEYERKLLVTRYKFGVLRVAAGQTGEDEIYANTEMTAPFERFLGVLGDRIALLGFDGYTGGLNTRDGSTGEHSVYCKFQNFEVMFHIAPMLPFFEDDKQQVERKRHLGNDVVLVIFLEPNASAFDPRILTSHFNSAFVIVRPVAGAGADPQYDVAVVYRSDVRPVRPFFSINGGTARLTGTRDEMHTALLTKLVNLERAAMSSGEFVGLDMRTRNLMLGDICNTLRDK